MGDLGLNATFDKEGKGILSVSSTCLEACLFPMAKIPPKVLENWVKELEVGDKDAVVLVIFIVAVGVSFSEFGIYGHVII